MSTRTLLSLIIGIVVIGGGVYYFVQKDDTTVTVSDGTQMRDVSVSDGVDLGKTQSACELLTAGMLTDILGSGAQVADSPSATVSSSTDDVAVTNCLYDTGSDDSFDTVNLLVRAGKTSTGRETNTSFYDTSKQEAYDLEGNVITAEIVSGVGDKAFWNPSFQQLVVLEDDGTYWFSLGIDVDAAPTAAESKPMTIQLAQDIIDAL